MIDRTQILIALIGQLGIVLVALIRVRRASRIEHNHVLGVVERIHNNTNGRLSKAIKDIVKLRKELEATIAELREHILLKEKKENNESPE